MLSNRYSLVASLVVSFALLIIGCDKFLNPEDEEAVAPSGAVELNTIITEGPADSATLLYYSSPTFRWKGEVSPGYIVGFKWEFDTYLADTLYDTETSGDWSMDMTKTFTNLTDASYVFSVWAKDDKDSVDATPDSISFSVLPTDSTAPAIRFIQSPTDSSYRPPGANVFFEWTASDSSTFGSVAGYSYRLHGEGPDSTSWSSYDLNTTTAAYSDLQLEAGSDSVTYTFQVRAKDNAGVVSVPSGVTFTVKNPTILVVDDYTPADSPFLNEIDTDNIIGKILRDWSWEEWDVVSQGGYPTSTDLDKFNSVIWYVDESAGPFYNYMLSPDSAKYEENPLDDYLDGGGNLWLMGGEVLFSLSTGLETWGDFMATNDTLVADDTSGLPISGKLSKHNVYKNTLSLTVEIAAFGEITVDTLDTDSLVYDTTWTSGIYTESITDDGDGNLIGTTSQIVGSISYGSHWSRASISIDTLSTDLSNVDILHVTIVLATEYHHKYQPSDMFSSDKFTGEYLHLLSGDDAGDDEFTGLTSLGVSGFDDIGIPGLATGTGWPDELTPDSLNSDVSAIYDLGGYSEGTTAGILYDGSDYNLVFWSVNFAFVATNHVHLTLAPADMYPVANHILEDVFGE